MELIILPQVASFLGQLIEIPAYIMETGGGELKQQRANLKIVVVRFKKRTSFFAFSPKKRKRATNQTFQSIRLKEISSIL